MNELALAEVLLEGLPEALREAAPPARELAKTLGDLVREAQAVWPQAGVSGSDLVAYLAERLPTDRDCRESIALIRAPDLLLACACAHGEEWAVDAFAAQYAPVMRAAVQAAKLPGVHVDDVVQGIQERLFVANGDDRARILDYQGRGPLAAWLRISATRAAVSAFRKARLQTPTSRERLAHFLEQEFDPELGYLKEMYKEQFAQAFRGAVEALETRDRSLLRYHYIDGLTLAEVAALYGVHRATIARWTAAARERVVAEMLSVLRRGLGISDSEFQSVVRLMRSQLDISVRRLFEE